MKNIYTIIVFAFLSIIATKINSQNTEIWGVSNNGGSFGTGALFTTDANGDSFNTEYSFNIENEGEYFDGKMIEAPNGKLYGVTLAGGANDDGILFEYDPSTNNYTVLVTFNEDINGRNPKGPLLLANNGKLYGVTYMGGSVGVGTIFEYDIINSTFNTVYTFNNASSSGKYPNAGLIEIDNDVLLGSTTSGGANGYGNIYKYDLNTSTFSIKRNIYGYQGKIAGGMFFANDGLIYLTTSMANYEYLYQYNYSTNAFLKKGDFSDIGASSPVGFLVQANNGNLYGASTYGGDYSNGTIFEYNITTEELIKKVDFKNDSIGERPTPLTLLSNGNFYTSTRASTTLDSSMLIEYNITLDSIIVKQSFPFNESYNAIAGLIEASNGSIYGYGVNESFETIIDYNLFSNTIINKIEIGKNEGKYPSNLTQAYNGKLYGVTRESSLYGGGSLYEFNPETYTYQTIYSFRNSTGYYPNMGLLIKNNGKIYGVTEFGGNNDKGVLYEYDLNTNVYTVLNYFNDTLGKYPIGNLLMADNGKLYGVAVEGGNNDFGVLFEYDLTSNIFSVLVNFDTNIGTYPKGYLVQDENGKIYGTTAEGGDNNKGVIFELDPLSNNYNIRVHFNSGDNPTGKLTKANDGYYYGTTSNGGVSNRGVIYKYNPYNHDYAVIYDFVYSTGAYPNGPLLFANNGNLYGTTSTGGEYYVAGYKGGVLYEYNINDSTYTVKKNFSDTTGKTTFLSELIEINSCYTVNSNITEFACGTYTVPSGAQTYSQIGNYTVTDTLSRNCGEDSIVSINLTVQELPNVVANASDTTICNGESVTLYGSGANTYVWDNSILDNTEFTPTETLTYTVTGINGNCENTAQITVNVTPIPEQPTIILYGGDLISSATTGNQWYYSTFALPGETNQTLTPQSNGDYFVEVTENGCSIMSEVYNYNTTNILNTNNDNSFSIYPNPGNNFIVIKNSFYNIENIQILDLTGKIIIDIKANNKKINVDISEFKTGVYFVKVLANNNSNMKKLIVE